LFKAHFTRLAKLLEKITKIKKGNLTILLWMCTAVYCSKKSFIFPFSAEYKVTLERK